VANDLVEEVSLVDEFSAPGKGTSHCYRLSYRSHERSLTDAEVNDLQAAIRAELESSAHGFVLR